MHQLWESFCYIFSVSCWVCHLLYISTCLEHAKTSFLKSNCYIELFRPSLLPKTRSSETNRSENFVMTVCTVKWTLFSEICVEQWKSSYTCGQRSKVACPYSGGGFIQLCKLGLLIIFIIYTDRNLHVIY